MNLDRSDPRMFVDTSAYFAIASVRDENHRPAAATMEHLLRTRRRLVTTNFVIDELQALIVNRYSQPLALETTQNIRASPVTSLVRIRVRDEERAWEILRQYSDKDFTLTDATSFAVMERLGISTVFTFDRHFAQFGWIVVPAPSPRQQS